MSSHEASLSRTRGSHATGDQPSPKRARVLDPLDRVPEVVFGALMAVSFTGSISVAESGSAEVRTMIGAALGCNIAWGLTDAVMYLLGVVTDRHRRLNLLRQLQKAPSPQEAYGLIAEALPERLAAMAGTEVMEGLRIHLLLMRLPKSILSLRDFQAALGVFILVVLSTFPIVMPFLLTKDVATALRISNGLALATLFIGGYVLGKYAGASPWRYGFALTIMGAGLIAAIIALGG